MDDFRRVAAAGAPRAEPACRRCCRGGSWCCSFDNYGSSTHPCNPGARLGASTADGYFEMKAVGLCWRTTRTAASSAHCSTKSPSLVAAEAPSVMTARILATHRRCPQHRADLVSIPQGFVTEVCAEWRGSVGRPGDFLLQRFHLKPEVCVVALLRASPAGRFWCFALLLERRWCVRLRRCVGAICHRRPRQKHRVEDRGRRTTHPPH
jgi:hypothetical protein